MTHFKPKLNKRSGLRNVILAILPGIIVAGLIFAANTYYDLDLGKVVIEEITKIVGQLETTATTTLATISGFVGVGTASPEALLHIYGSNNAVKLSYDASNYSTLSTANTGELNIVSSTTSESAIIVGSGAASQDVSLKLFGQYQSYYLGLDNSNNDLFSIGLGGTVGASSTLAIDTSGNVGIGTTTFPAKLTVLASGSQESGLKIEISATTSGYYILNALSGGSSKLYVGADGYVGVGTASPGYTLDVNGGLRSVSATYLGTNNAAVYIGGTSNSGTGDLYLADLLYDWDNTAYYLDLDNTNISALFAGKVGIGTTTPASLLELYQTTASPILTITSATSTTYSPQIAFRTGATPATRYTIGTNIADNTLKLVYGSDISTSTGLTINSSGYVGIGTTSPAYALDVVGYVRGTTGLCIGADCRTSWPAGGSGESYWLLSSNYLYTSSTAWNVGIGTTTPSSKLTVSGDLFVTATTTLGSATSTQLSLQDTQNQTLFLSLT
jgi:hypothetical protein